MCNQVNVRVRVRVRAVALACALCVARGFASSPSIEANGEVLQLKTAAEGGVVVNIGSKGTRVRCVVCCGVRTFASVKGVCVSGTRSTNDLTTH